MSKNPKVSIIIPAYNMASTLESAIHSVIHQTLTDFEIIIVDDGSTDNTKEVIKGYLKKGNKEKERIKYLFQKNQGRGGALNTGARISKGEYITFLDADDVLTENSLQVRTENLDRFPEAAIAFADAYYTDHTGKPYKLRRSLACKDSRELLKALLNNPTTPIIGPTVMIRRDIFLLIGGYNPVYRRNQDQELHIRILKGYDFTYIPEPVLYYRTYLRRSKIMRYKINGLKSWNRIIDSYIPERSTRIYLKSKRFFFEFLKLSYETFFYKK